MFLGLGFESFMINFRDVTRDLSEYFFKNIEYLEKSRINQKFKVEEKTDLSFVTNIDLMLHDGLIKILSKYHSSIISEEGSEGDRHDRFWLIDPLDGTSEFISNSRDYSINVAFIDRGEVIYGWMGFPGYGDEYFSDNKKVYRKTLATVEEIITPSIEKKNQKLKVGLSLRQIDSMNKILKLEEVSDNIEINIIGASRKYIALCSGLIDIYPRLGPTGEWDTAAGHYLIHLLGGIFTDWNLNTINYGKLNYKNQSFICSLSQELLNEGIAIFSRFIHLDTSED